MVIRNALFFAVADIQEFYELTLLDESKSVQQKTAETIRIADKWEASDGPITPTFAQNDVSNFESVFSRNRSSRISRIYLRYPDAASCRDLAEKNREKERNDPPGSEKLDRSRSMANYAPIIMIDCGHHRVHPIKSSAADFNC